LVPVSTIIPVADVTNIHEALNLEQNDPTAPSVPASAYRHRPRVHGLVHFEQQGRAGNLASALGDGCALGSRRRTVRLP
jgi:hypothetical protein